MSHQTNLEAAFNRIADILPKKLSTNTCFTLTLTGENTQFVRFNQAKVRQTGTVRDGQLTLTLMGDQRSGSRQVDLTGNWDMDWAVVEAALGDLQDELPQLPIDPYLVMPSGNNHSHEVHQGDLLDPISVVPTLLPLATDLDFAGIYAAGELVRAYADSAGQRHWFATESFDLDYSLFTPHGQAIKNTLANTHWQMEEYEAQITDAKAKLKLLNRPTKTIDKGQYRTYLAPAAVAELTGLLNWGGFSEAALQQGGSCFGALQLREKSLSPKFNLRENFQYGLVPRFNELGDVAAVGLPIVTAGRLVNTLVSRRSAKEYGKVANGANADEELRSPEISPGHLAPEQILTALDTGLYVSNLHYLNWSDRPAGRITGMTRYACFWVEAGEITAPIENLRFDDSLYNFFGDRLIDLTTHQEFVPEINTYENRQIGGTHVPGILVEDFTYTL